MARVIDGRFELVARLGGGGMGTVWRARDLALHREVALKEVRPPDPALAEYDPEGARELRIRVLREARALARVAHPQVVTIYHIVDGGEGTYPWLVMELVSGGSLHDRLARGTLTAGEAATLGRGILAGLRAAHATGIQHRDIKPANVLLRPDGRPVLTDFGIAAIHGATALTAAGSIIGTPDYMAPERVAGEEGGPAADLWSLAMTLYVAVEGHHPLRRANTLATLAAVLGEDVPAPRRAGPLTGVLTDVLVRDPAARPDGEALDRLLAEAEVRAAKAPGQVQGQLRADPRDQGRVQDQVPAQGPGRAQDPRRAQDRSRAQDPRRVQDQALAQDAGQAQQAAQAQGPVQDAGPRPLPPPQPHPHPRLHGEASPVPAPASPSPTADTATATFGAVPPVPTRPPTARRRHAAVYAGAAGAVVLSGVLLWNLLPLGGAKDDGTGDRTAGKPGGRSPSSSTAASAPPPTGNGIKITIGVKSDQPGLGWKRPDGTYTGLDVDVATYLARALGHGPADIAWKEVRSSTREALLANGDVDLVVATYTMTSQRKTRVGFAGPYFTAHQDVLLAAGDTSVRNPADLNGKKVCGATGTTGVLAIRTRLAPQAEVVTYDSHARCIDALASGTVDAVTTDDALLAGYAAQDGYKGRFKLAGFRVSEEPYGIGVPKGSAMEGKVQKALDKMISDGSWKRAVEKNLPLLRTATPPLRD
ncbi:bifunctional serine/threonine-protein kinase/glutamate ABC transporter substrate-binding protein [Streptomyces sp. Qhu_M48]|uniref:bifunctional serine/threonine-protein kinase/glutamate ABC transporter substrate-binding protein n=1 Tax=Streptomyces sp. Qhu_M48 TaxID=3435889 RepID=UPI003F5056FB